MSALAVMRHAATRLDLTADTLQDESAREYRHSAQRLRTARMPKLKRDKGGAA